MKVWKLLESETQKRRIIICDRKHNELQLKNIDEALVLPIGLLEKDVLKYECPDNQHTPIRITI